VEVVVCCMMLLGLKHLLCLCLVLFF
jgi:hypothetical protein